MIFISTYGDDFRGAKAFWVGNFKSVYLGVGLELQERQQERQLERHRDVGINTWVNQFVVFWNRRDKIDGMFGDKISRLLIAYGDRFGCHEMFLRRDGLSCLDFVWHSLPASLAYSLRSLKDCWGVM